MSYSSDGTLAAFIAARESSVSKLITIASPIDHKAWKNYHQISALSSLLSSQDNAENLAKIPQVHFTGGRDEIVPSQLTQAWAKELRESYPRASIEIITLKDADHHCCWAEQWQQLSQQFLATQKPEI